VSAQNGDADIFVITTNNGGLNWGSAVRVNDDAQSNGKHQDMVWASYNAAGRLMVTWRDRRNGTGTGFQQPSDTYASLSVNNGATFTTNFRLSTATAPFDSVLYQDGNDFMGCQLVGDSICAAWGDVRSGKLNIYFAKASDSTGISAGVIEVASEDLFEMNVFPNPAREKVTVSFPFSPGEGVLEITDNEGRAVFHKNKPKETETVDCRNLAEGIYYAVFTVENYSLKHAFVIQK